MSWCLRWVVVAGVVVVVWWRVASVREELEGRVGVMFVVWCAVLVVGIRSSHRPILFWACFAFVVHCKLREFGGPSAPQRVSTSLCSWQVVAPGATSVGVAS